MQSVSFQKRNLLDSLISTIGEFLIVLCDDQERVVSCSKSLYEQFGYEPEQILGKSIQQIAEPAGGPDLVWVFNKDGEKCLTSGFLFPLAGQKIVNSAASASSSPLGSALILRTISQANSSQINSRALIGALENSNLLICNWDGAICFWSEGCERLYGFAESEAIGQNIRNLLRIDSGVDQPLIHEALSNDGVWRGELKYHRKDNLPVLAAVQSVRLESVAEGAPLVVSIHADITSRLEMQDKLEAANSRLKRMADELERSNEELEEFARIASHDLSTPIASTRWLVDILTSRHGHQLDDEGQKALKQVSISLERMSDLVEAILAHARVGTTQISTFDEGDTELAVAVALENLRYDVAATGACVHHERLPLVLVGQQALTQLFQNLLSNAIKYRRPSVTPEIEIKTLPLGPLWRFELIDNGEGIETEWLERIFLPMQRRHSSKIAGSGIGLATCRKIVNRAGGRIWAESNLGRGSTFFFTLPAAAIGSEGSDPTEPSHNP